MKYTILLLLLFAMYKPLYSQKNTGRQYYTDLKGDTIRGKFPNVKQWVHNPGEVELIGPDNREIKLTSQNCRSFHAGEYDNYVAYEGSRMINPLEDGQSNTPNLPDTYDTLHTFLKVLYHGINITLYSYTDKK